MWGILCFIFLTSVFGNDCCYQTTKYVKEWEEGVDEFMFNGEGDYIGFDPGAKEIYAETVKLGQELMEKSELPPGEVPRYVQIAETHEDEESKKIHKQVAELRRKKARILAGLEEEEKPYKIGYL